MNWKHDSIDRFRGRTTAALLHDACRCMRHNGRVSESAVATVGAEVKGHGGQWLVLTRTGDNWSITSHRYTARRAINRVRLSARRVVIAGSKFTAVGREGRPSLNREVNVSCGDDGDGRDSCDTGQCMRNICWPI